MGADFIVIVKVHGTSVSWTRNVRLWSPLIYLLDHASLRLNCSIIIKPANLLLEHKMSDFSGDDMTKYELSNGVVLSFSRMHESNYALWLVQCLDCGKIRELSSANIKRISGQCPSCAQKKFGAPRTIDGKRTPEYVAWCGMRERCGFLKGRQTYVEKGITVWEGWLGPNGFDEFYDHVGQRPSDAHSLDRIDNLDDYKPGNVRWATKSQQNSNKSDTKIIEIDGLSKPFSHWCQDFGIYPEAVHSRIASGWSMEDAITKPFRPVRPDVDAYYLGIALDVAKRSTCIRRAVGAVITDSSGYCVSTGYNSVPAGLPHCNEKPCAGAFAKSGESLHLCSALHAEDVALMKCKDIQQIGTVYVTASPCIFCTRKLLNTSAKRIVFIEQYPHTESMELWTSVGREWIHRPNTFKG